jgi:hypothetical protein
VKARHVLPLAIAMITTFAQDQAPPRALERIQREVRHELPMLPYLTVFDYLAYAVHGYDVTLRARSRGQC